MSLYFYIHPIFVVHVYTLLGLFHNNFMGDILFCLPAFSFGLLSLSCHNVCASSVFNDFNLMWRFVLLYVIIYIFKIHAFIFFYFCNMYVFCWRGLGGQIALMTVFKMFALPWTAPANKELCPKI